MSEVTNFLRKAYEAAAKSIHPDTQVGAVLGTKYNEHVLIESCNEFPPGIEPTPECLVAGVRSHYFEHAESSCVLKFLTCTDDHSYGKFDHWHGPTLYCTWAACAGCARAIIYSGIKRVVRHVASFQAVNAHWTASVEEGLKMLRKANIEVVDVSEKLDAVPIRFGGQIVYP